ncbi:MAG: hypothetical protein WDK96_03290 [Candidatus Paceibacterota bacterium]
MKNRETPEINQESTISNTLEKEFPSAAFKEIVEHNNEKYIKSFYPSKIKEGKVEKWVPQWIKLDDNFNTKNLLDSTEELEDLGYKEGNINDLKRTHKTPISFTDLDGKKVNLPARWIIRVDVKKYIYENIWIQTIVDDGSEEIPLKIRSLIVKEFLSELMGKAIIYSNKPDTRGSDFSHYSIEENVLPKQYRELDSFSKIYKWFVDNQPEIFGKDFENLIKKSKDQTQNTRKANIEALNERREKAIKVAFKEGIDSRSGNKQWEARVGGILYILDRSSARTYNPSEGPIPVEKNIDIIPNKVVLVSRI